MFIGVDIGKSGGVAIKYSNNSVEVFSLDMKRIDLINRIERSIHRERYFLPDRSKPKILAVIEQLDAATIDSTEMSHVLLGMMYERPIAILETLRVPIQYVTSNQMYEEMKITRKRTLKGELASFNRKAKSLYPSFFEDKDKQFINSVAKSVLLMQMAGERFLVEDKWRK